MATNLDSLGLSPDMSGAARGVRAGTTPTGSWMLELERAFLAETPKASSVLGQPSVNVAVTNPAISDSQRDGGGQAMGGDRTATSESEKHVTPLANSIATKSFSDATASPDEPSPQARSSGSVSVSKRINAPHDQGMDAVGLGVMPAATLFSVETNRPLGGDVGVLATLIHQPGILPMNAGSTVPALTEEALANDYRVTPLPAPIDSTKPIALTEGSEESGIETEEAEADRTSPSEPSADVDQFAARILHLYHGADGVQAWIRDAGLNDTSGQQVGQALSAELQNAGSRLNSLVVNGRKIAGVYGEGLYQEEATGDWKESNGSTDLQPGPAYQQRSETERNQ
ncbi:hypothetical protein ACO0LO_10465 [Undibacterium sp. TJN25]|uniref:hypothetical protein n=1 Tax=Undibacterium sp. TJN25 TaxID=3413056 RepID=UPI003BF00104